MRSRISLAIAALSLLAQAPAVRASPQDALTAFDGLCVATDGKLALIEKLAKSKGAKSLPKEALAGDIAFSRFGGKGFAFQDGSFKYAVVATNIGTCSVLVMESSVESLVSLIERNYALSKPYVESSGPQIVRMYKAVETSSLAGSKISIMAPKAGFTEKPYYSIGFIPVSAKGKY